MIPMLVRDDQRQVCGENLMAIDHAKLHLVLAVHSDDQPSNLPTSFLAIFNIQFFWCFFWGQQKVPAPNRKSRSES
jgi:hypothetical protein